MTGLHLKQFPKVCRLCFKPDSGVMHSITENLDAMPFSILTFLKEVTFRIEENKVEHMPKVVCDTCLEQLTSFVVYRNRIILTQRLMEAIVDVKHSDDSEPLTALFRDNKNELNALFEDLSLCDKSEPQVADIMQALEDSKLMNSEMVVKLEHVSTLEDDDMHDDLGDEYPDSPQSEMEIKPDIYKAEKDVSSDDEPLAKRKKRTVKSKSATAVQSDVPKRKGRPRIHPYGNILPEPWSCDKCTFTTKLRKSVPRHVKMHEIRENRVFPCSICGMAFKTKALMRKHSTTHPENQFMCEVCGSSLRSSESLRTHMERHDDSQKLTCEYCTYTTPYVQNLKSHMKTHTSENFKKQCEVCKATFRSTHLLNRHLETHSDERKYPCEECSARFKTRNALRNHRNCVHLVIRYPCEYCEKRFDQKLTMRDHVERVHNIQANFPCEICLLTVDSQEKLDTHLLRHENPKPLECGRCLTLHADQEAYDAHLCISYRDDYICCGREYRNYAQYNRHMWTKHGLKTNVRVKPIPGVLVGQLRRTRKRLIRCRKCDILFPTKAEKLQHMIGCDLMNANQ